VLAATYDPRNVVECGFAACFRCEWQRKSPS